MCSDDNWSHRTPQDYRRHGLLHVPGCGRYGISRSTPLQESSLPCNSSGVASGDCFDRLVLQAA
jgi:hypothetical protein